MKIRGFSTSIERVVFRFLHIVMAGSAHTAAALDFSAERIVKNGESVVTAHVNAKDDRWRLEFSQPQRGASVIGFVGTLIGTVLGIITALNVSQWIAVLERVSGRQIFSSDVYFVSYLPSELQLGDVLLICGAALLLSFLATIYPAWRAAQTQPAEALRYE